MVIQHMHTAFRRTASIGVALATLCAGMVIAAPNAANAAPADTGSPQLPKATDIQMIAFQQTWNTIAEECGRTYGPEGMWRCLLHRNRSEAPRGGPPTSRSAIGSIRNSAPKPSSRPWWNSAMRQASASSPTSCSTRRPGRTSPQVSKQASQAPDTTVRPATTQDSPASATGTPTA